MNRLVLLLIAVFGSVFAMSGCSGSDTFTHKEYFSGENRIERITVSVEDREVDISPSEDNGIYISYFDGEKEYLDISLSDGGELTVKLVYNKNWTDYIGVKAPSEYRKIEIKIPDNLIAALSVSTTNGDIKVGTLSFNESVKLDTNGGDILFDRINAGKYIDLKCKNGDITGTISGGWAEFSIVCKIKNGNSNLPALKEGGEKSLSADCNNGDISIEFVR